MIPIPGGLVPTLLIITHSLQKDKIFYQYYYYLSGILLYDLIHHSQQSRLPITFYSSQQFQATLSTTIRFRAYHLVSLHVN